MLSDDQRNQAAEVFRAYGYAGPLRIARRTGLEDDRERTFVLPPVALAALPERSLTLALEEAIGGKVGVVSEGPAWPETEPLR